MANDQLKDRPEPEPNAQTIRVYSNYASVTSTPEEFILRFGERGLKDPSDITEIVRVFLSLSHAKRLVVAMARSLKAYEDIFGEIVADPIQTLSEEQKQKLGLDDTRKK